jgi:dephospho-CoA kinase
LAILASPEVRYKRESKRARFGKVSKLSFRVRDRGELRIGVGDLVASADYFIDANQSWPNIKKQASKILKSAL